MITYAELSAPLDVQLDDRTSQRYRPIVRIGAMNSAVNRAASALGWAMANRKGPEEALRELTMMRIFQTNTQGGINLNDPSLGHVIWNVLGVYARPEIVEPGAVVNPLDPGVSQYRPDLSFSGTGPPVERVTLEEVPMIRRNFLRNGNEILAGNPKRVTYAYYIIGDASSTGYSSGTSELRVLPQSQTSAQFIAMSYVKQPSAFVDTTSSVEFPQSFKQTLADWTLQYLAGPQGDGTSLYSTSEKDAAQLFSFIA
jgi:hypothetical protein